MTNKATPRELLERAKIGNGKATEALWRAIDAGEADDDVALEWIRNVAGQVVSKVINSDIPANRSLENCRAALGFEGRRDKFPELAEICNGAEDFTPAQLANAAPLLIDTRGFDDKQIERKITYLKKKKQ